MNQPEINVGIDTSKGQLDIGIISSNQFSCASNDGNGITSAIEKLLLTHPDRVVIEATGRLEFPFAITAYRAGLSIVIGDAAHGGYLAKSTEKLRPYQRFCTHVLSA
ncbi:hypothetical protein GCM10008090_01130 [Arenicella chitinivorans]|uniref:Transposase n=1 Tax=Arenicella chitinivorans TaxID=1329800 RepID=A0A918RED0_9GAMM|nr:hypothetical protein [Arenicella chitinivorans]GGZ96672.1 hypothetical protein GCM10008090_01130 [Arenicella chitinivorans]